MFGLAPSDDSMSMSEESLLQVRNLRVRYQTGSQSAGLSLDGVSFQMSQEAIGLVGESGSGKTSLALTIGGLLPQTGRIESGSVIFRGKDLIGMPERDLRKVRGAQISFIFQEPAAALNPVMRVGDQIAEVIRAHLYYSPTQRRAMVGQWLQRVHLPDSEWFYRSYPHEISGGQRQRVVIAQALACNPLLLIADEPTTALDTITQAEILGLLKEMKAEIGLALLIISHAPTILAGLVDRVVVMQRGKIVEQGPYGKIVRQPAHSYTKRLPGMAKVPPEAFGTGPHVT